ncbi:MAG: NlpC/P60 family protein, partial [Coriobacteriia bacterium]|nr:NlpC/P60 family protein [Coriobacteriia bacterium]
DQLDELQAQLELRSEEYASATEDLEATRVNIEKTRSDLEIADRDLASATEKLQDRVANIYRKGNLSLIEVLLGTSSFQDFLNRVELLRRISESDALLVSTVKTARENVRLTQESLVRRESDQVVLRERAKSTKREVEMALKIQAEFVTGLNSQVRTLIAQEQEHQERLAAERAAVAAATAARTASGTKNTPPAGGNLGAGYPEVVTVALAFVGQVPYLWGGTTPSGFDCSGLTRYCYAQLGISIPRTSRSQFRSGSYIPPDNLDVLVPGDLVFFGYGGDANKVHHVGIYVGDGNYVHAPATGQLVTVSSLTERISNKGDYVGAVRY